jgi:hypothetical protein
MATKIAPELIQNLQQIETVVAGPDDANRLFIIDGQFDLELSASTGGNFVSQKEIFTVLIGPVLQFLQANATVSLTKIQFHTAATAMPVRSNPTWRILGVDADWDDESSQVELRIEAEVGCSGAGHGASINGFAFHVTILAAIGAV